MKLDDIKEINILVRKREAVKNFVYDYGDGFELHVVRKSDDLAWPPLPADKLETHLEDYVIINKHLNDLKTNLLLAIDTRLKELGVDV